MNILNSPNSQSSHGRNSPATKTADLSHRERCAAFTSASRSTKTSPTAIGRRSSLLASVVFATTLTVSSACFGATWSNSWLPVPDTGSSWHTLTGPFLTDTGCSAAAYFDLSYPLFIVAKRAGFQTIWLNSTSSDPALQHWDGWREIPGGAHTAYPPSISYYYGSATPRLDVVAVGILGGSDQKIYLNSYSFTAKVWTGWNVVPGLATNAGVSIVNRQLYAKGLGYLNYFPAAVYQNDFESNGWTGWNVVPGGLGTKVQICAYQAAEPFWITAALWAARSDGKLCHNSPAIFGTGWLGWTPLNYQAVTEVKPAGPLPVYSTSPDYVAFINGVGDHQVHGLKTAGSQLIPGNKLTDAGLESCSVLFFQSVNSQGDTFRYYRNLLFAKGMGDQKLYFNHYISTETIKQETIK